VSILLALESGGEHFSAALSVRGEVLSETAPAGQSQHALPLVGRLLSSAGITLQDCDAFAFAAGPGRFSGLRLSCSIVQALAYSTDRPGIPVGSFAALAEANYGDETGACEAAIPAYRAHIYTAHCTRDTTWCAPQPTLAKTADYVPSADTRNICGEAFASDSNLVTNPDVKLGTAPADAAAVVRVASVLYQEGNTVSAMECQPLYIRRQVAKTIAERKQG